MGRRQVPVHHLGLEARILEVFAGLHNSGDRSASLLQQETGDRLLMSACMALPVNKLLRHFAYRDRFLLLHCSNFHAKQTLVQTGASCCGFGVPRLAFCAEGKAISGSAGCNSTFYSDDESNLRVALAMIEVNRLQELLFFTFFGLPCYEHLQVSWCSEHCSHPTGATVECLHAIRGSAFIGELWVLRIGCVI